MHIHLNQSDRYFNNYFNQAFLPDLKRCGPISASILRAMRDPLKFLKAPKDPTTPAMLNGSLVDCLWLEPERFNDVYYVLPPEAPSKPSQRQRDAKKPSQSTIDAIAFWDSIPTNSIVIDDATVKAAKNAIEALQSHAVAQAFHSTSNKQVTIAGILPLHGNHENLEAQALLDMLAKDGSFICDLKQTHDISPRALINTIWKYEYYVQLAFYRLLAKTAGLETTGCYLLFQRSNPPYDVHPIQLDEDYLSYGEKVCQERFDALKLADPQDIEPFLDYEIKTLSLPSWSQTENANN